MRFIAAVGARPNFVKAAALVKAMRENREIHLLLVHTGQHYDESMSKQFFKDLDIPSPDINLNVGSGTQATQTAEILKRFEPVVADARPDLVIVVGDVNSTIACALTAKKMNVDVAHIEAGLRSFDRTMPEEINRVVTDAIADLHFITEKSAARNLRQEGITPERIFFVGNLMIDTLLAHRAKAEASSIRARLGLDSSRPYALVTLHRPRNVDHPAVLEGLLRALDRLAATVAVIFPIHPRTLRNAEAAGLEEYLKTLRVRIVDPLGYLDFLNLMNHAALVITDSGGIQEETTILGIPCLTVSDNTERPITLEQGTNQLVGCNPQCLVDAATAILAGRPKPHTTPKFWDGRAAERTVRILVEQYCSTSGRRPLAARRAKSVSVS
jgi:UDP-N-acetylglucosamine 2-epimerase (non-hydrolysing)